MLRLTQIIQNLYIRFEGLLYQLFGFLRQLFGWLSQRFNFFLKLFGFTESQYFLEDSQQGTNSAAKTESDMAASPPQAPSDASATRRRPDASMDYFRKLAQPKKFSK